MNLRYIAIMILILVFTASCKKDTNNNNNNPPPENTTVTDIDGNIYNTVTIGTQVWMKENLKVTRYRNGDEIPLITDSTQWRNLLSDAYCNYNNDVSSAGIYGKLYNWYVVNDSRNIAPEGWHIPTNEEWTTLIDYLGGSSVAGGKMKKVGTNHWADPNTGATDESGFTALPNGYRFSTDGLFYLIGKGGYWWSSTEADADNAWFASVIYNNTNAPQYYYSKKYGYALRCVKD